MNTFTVYNKAACWQANGLVCGVYVIKEEDLLPCDGDYLNDGL
jgi:hypothetical protein